MFRQLEAGHVAAELVAGQLSPTEVFCQQQCNVMFMFMLQPDLINGRKIVVASPPRTIRKCSTGSHSFPETRVACPIIN